MEPDFSGYATKAGVRCTDGRTIMPNAFQHQDKHQVPLVWQHGHGDPENVLGHVVLEHREDGVYCHAFFNKSTKAQHAKELVDHKDIKHMSIWANQLIERSKNVLHGAIREVSLVLSGANPGALIENVTIRHSADYVETLDDEVQIFSGEEIVHSSDVSKEEKKIETSDEDAGENIEHAEDNDGDNDETVQAIYDSMSEKQQAVVHYMLTKALGHSDLDVDGLLDEGTDAKGVYDSLNTQQKDLLHSMLDEALESAKSDETNDDADSGNNQEGNEEMKHKNIFENQGDAEQGPVLSHEDVAGIVADATKSGSLKDAVESYALAHGITNIDQMFPDARNVNNVPEFLSRRTEWVQVFLDGSKKSPFSRIRTLSADITAEEARAKGYVKGEFKKEEFFPVVRRTTTPTTIYKKQKLDRDDMVDITDFDVVAWLKGEMRIMLDEEVARAGLVGDGRDISHEDKISETNIRPIASDHELYTTVVNVNIDDASSSVQEIIDAVTLNRSKLKGSGSPVFFTTEYYIARFLLLKDSTGRRIYKNLEEVAMDLRVSKIVPVEVMEEAAYEDIVGILVNPNDYTYGADKGGEISLFDDFDIDYNQYKYLIETRTSGALTKLKSAIVVKKVASTDALVSPDAPTFVAATGVVTIPTDTGVVYKNADTNATLSAGAQSALAAGATLNVVAVPASGYYFATSDDDTWSFTRPAA